MLRVIGGVFRSRKIKEVGSEKTRPTTDRNKEALFNTLGQFFDGGHMLDLFAGSGALGIEAISRGIEHVDFVDNYLVACKTIRENCESLGIMGHATILKQDCFAYLNQTEKVYDLIIADPPYALRKYDELLERIVSRQLIANNGIIVFEAEKNTELPEVYGAWKMYKHKIFGTTEFAFYRMEESS